VSLLVAFLRGRELRQVARLRTRREVVLADGAEIVDDSVAVLEGQRITRRFRELEVELVGGDEATLLRLRDELERAGATEGELRPKLYRALDLDVPRPVPIRRGTPPLPALGLALAGQAEALLVHDPGVRLGSDPEDLHQLRVATRRLRAFLRAGRTLLERSWSEPLRDEIGWLGKALGPARDLDVLIERLRGDIVGLGEDAEAVAGLLAALEEERAAARAVVVGALSSDRYLELLDRLDRVSTPEPSGVETPLRDLWAVEWRRTRTAFRRLDAESTGARLHEGRIHVKRARYAAELAAPELGKRGRAFVVAAKELQDVLGEHQDAVVAEARIQEWVAAGADEGVAARLVAREHERMEATRAAWPSAWKELRRAAKQLA
jgi:CHAD domain-containing protein